MPAAPARARPRAPVPAPTGRRPSAAPAIPQPRVTGPAVERPPAGPAIKLKDPKAARDPRFTRVMDKVQKSAATAKQHPPAGRLAGQAEAAARPPANERRAGAQANQVSAMEAAPTGKPEPTSFLALLRAEIKKVLPKKTEDAKDFMKGNDRTQLKGALTGNVSQQKDQAASGIQGAASQAPDESRVPPAETAPLGAEQPPPPPPAVGAAEAMPAPRPQEDVSLEAGRQDADKAMGDAELTTPQLQKANDPRFSAVLTAKQKVDQNATAAPQQFRAGEQGILAQAAARATGDERQELMAIRGQGLRSAGSVRARQLTQREKDEAERKKVADHIQGIFDRTKANVEKKLARLDDEVAQLFDQGADTAVARMKDYVESRFDDRYSGLGGKILWAKDKLLPLPDSVKGWFDEAQLQFAQDLDALVVRVAARVETRLKEAKVEIAHGQREIRDYVAGLPANLRSVGQAAEREMQGRFEDLSRSVDEKKGELAQKLAQRYKEASEKGDAALTAMKDAHKSLYEKLRDAILEVIRIIKEFKERVMAILRKSAATAKIIAADPIGFLGNLLRAIGKGIGQFVDNIWTHLKAGFMAWLFGTLGEAGIPVPSDFSLGSILQVVLAVLGLTYDRIRGKVARIVGERNVALIEKAWQFISNLLKNPASLWEQIKEYLSNLKETILEQIQSWLVTEIIKAAVTKLLSMFNPVGAIIQAIIMIVRTVMFFIERIRQILALVEAIIESIHKIAVGDIGAAANWIEQALARAVPVMIAFLAALLGISGITDKVKGIIKKLQDKVDKAVDKVINKIVGGIGKLVGAAKGVAGRVLEWWKAKKSFKAGDGQEHSIYISGTGRGATVMLASSPEAIRIFLSKGAKTTDPKVKDAHQKALATLNEIDKLKKSVPESGEGMYRIYDPMVREIDSLATHVNVLLSAGVLSGDLEIVGPLDIRRPPKFAPETRKALFEKYGKLHQQAKGEKGVLKAGLARRHIVSYYETMMHYKSSLGTRNFKEARQLLMTKPQVKSMFDPKKTPPKPVIVQAAQTLLTGFFNVTENLWVGDSAENSSIQEERDYPEGWTTKRIDSHVADMKRRWWLSQ